MNRDEEFLKSFDEAVLMYPEASALVVDKAAFQFFAGRIEEAKEGYARAAGLAPDHVSPLIGLGLCAARLGDFGTAIDWHEKAMRLEPDNSHGWCNFSETLLRAREFARAAKTAEEALAIEPENQYALGLMGLALRGANDAREEQLNDYDAFVQVFDLEPPAGYADMESFNSDLNAWLDRVHRDKREVLNQTLRGGTQSFDNLFGKGHDLVNRLEARIQEAVATYIARMPADAGHPLLKRRRNAFKYSAHGRRAWPIAAFTPTTCIPRAGSARPITSPCPTWRPMRPKRKAGSSSANPISTPASPTRSAAPCSRGPAAWCSSRPTCGTARCRSTPRPRARPSPSTPCRSRSRLQARILQNSVQRPCRNIPAVDG